MDHKKDVEKAVFVEKTDEEERQVRKVDMFPMPTIWVPYLYSYMDRTNIGNAKVAGMNGDIGPSSTHYFLAVVVFQIGYLNAESKRFIVFLSARILSGTFGGIVAGAITDVLDRAHDVAGWGWPSIVEGAATVGAAFIARFFLLDYPATTKSLTLRRRELTVARLQANGITSSGEHGELSEVPHWNAFMHSISNWRLWLLCACYMTIISCYSLGYVNPTWPKDWGTQERRRSKYMTVSLYVVAFAITFPTCILADRLHTYRPIMAAIVLALGSLFCTLSAGIYAYVLCYVFLCFINSAIWTANPLALSYASVPMGPLHQEARAISLALINGMRNLAPIYGSYLFQDRNAPKLLVGLGTYAGLLIFGAAVYTAVFVLFRRPFKART
ncbi:putative vitamin H transporter [Zopfia rhizophila CBS 207.26]|uniref:Putative vitamin H transporter n=1 Tax=Zopfia rhizophila CBS 207.26 TaxID=1314779 RepID=A0A6A6ERZ5_9PEZI|nr:putative vitamin H transporter [Zopfia rhizophila CBS 207.26]